MKPRLPELLALLLTCGVVAFWTPPRVAAQVSDTPPPLGVPTPAPTPEATATPPPPAPRGKGKNSKPPKVAKPKEFAFPLPTGESANTFKLPQMGMAGELLSQLMSAKITRLDNEHVEMHETKIDLYHPDGKEDFHVVLPDSIFNLKTQIIASDHPVTVRTDDFELTGERMQFNTVDRTGELQGHVHMVIHNFKQVAGVIPTAPSR